MSENSNKALERLMLLEKEAREMGFEWPHHQMLYDQMVSECKEVMSAIQEKEGHDRIQEELGDVIHTALSWCAFAGYDVHETIEKVEQKFGRRMHALKMIAKERGLNTLQGQPVSFLLELWEEAKKKSIEAGE